MNYSCVILAAGKGTRMKSDRIKILHEIMGKTIINYVLDVVDNIENSRPIMVVGHQRDKVQAHINRADVEYVVQEQQLGTGHAVMQTLRHLRKGEKVILLSGDVPLLQAETVQKLLRVNEEAGTPVTVLTAILDNPFGYGRIVRDGDFIREIVEQKDANAEVKKIKEINSGIYVFDADYLKAEIPKLKTENAQGEFYLTDVVKAAHQQGLGASVMVVNNPMEIEGINSRNQLANMQMYIADNLKEKLMEEGVTFINPELSAVNTLDIEIGKDTVVHPFTTFEGQVRIGSGCEIHPYSYLKDVTIKDESVVKPYSQYIGVPIK